MTEVTQADRELLCQISNWQKGSDNYDRVMSGTAWTWEVEKLAQHRIASQPAPVGDVAELVERSDRAVSRAHTFCAEVLQHRKNTPWTDRWEAELKALANEVRAQNDALTSQQAEIEALQINKIDAQIGALVTENSKTLLSILKTRSEMVGDKNVSELFELVRDFRDATFNKDVFAMKIAELLEQHPLTAHPEQRGRRDAKQARS